MRTPTAGRLSHGALRSRGRPSSDGRIPRICCAAPAPAAMCRWNRGARTPTQNGARVCVLGPRFSRTSSGGVHSRRAHRRCTSRSIHFSRSFHGLPTTLRHRRTRCTARRAPRRRGVQRRLCKCGWDPRLPRRLRIRTHTTTATSRWLATSSFGLRRHRATAPAACACTAAPTMWIYARDG